MDLFSFFLFDGGVCVFYKCSADRECDTKNGTRYNTYTRIKIFQLINNPMNPSEVQFHIHMAL